MKREGGGECLHVLVYVCVCLVGVGGRGGAGALSTGGMVVTSVCAYQCVCVCVSQGVRGGEGKRGACECVYVNG